VRSESEIRHKLSELLSRCLKRMRDDYLSQIPRNCAFNTRMRVKGQGKVGFCQNPTVLNTLGVKVFVCHEEEAAKQCKMFRCRNTMDSVDGEFRDILRSPQRCGEKFPKLAVLIWVIQDREVGNKNSWLAKLWQIFRWSD
jgi:hypothetical protein